MKKIIILIALVCGFVTTRCDTVEPKNPTPKIKDTTSIEDFYYNGDTKIPLKRVKNKYFVIYDSAVDLTHLFENAKVTYEEKDKLLPITPYKDFKYSDSTKHCIIECNTSMKEISNNKNIYYVAPVYSNKDTSISALSNIFLVQLKPENDINLLETLASENNVKIAGTLIFSPKFYFLICDKNSNGNALEIANLFYETGNFISCTPDLLSNQDPYECVNDANFWSQ